MFHGPLNSDFGQIIKVKIFVQGRPGIILAQDFCEKKIPFGQNQWEIFKFNEIFFLA